MEITLNELKVIAGDKNFNIRIIEKDYLLTQLLYLLRDVDGIYFKGGTALNKIFLNHARLSEDLDFTTTKKVPDIEKQIRAKLKGTKFDKITHDKRVDKFTRLIVHYKLFHEDGTIFIDLNQRAKLNQKPEKHAIKHFYPGFIPEFSVNTLSKEEMIAEKVSAAISRNAPRDHFDLYTIISHKIQINQKLVKGKCKQSGHEFNIIKMFKNANKLKNKWDEDVRQLLPTETSFIQVMQTLAKHFKYKEKKKAKKKPVQK
jgi:predicted nucleotidyltransferase component of viral defense system